MTTHLLLRNRLQLVRDDLNDVVSRVSDDILEWVPREGMPSIRGQLLEIVGTEIQLITWIRERREIGYQDALSDIAPGLPLEGIKAKLGSVRAETLTYLDSLSEENLNELIAFPGPWFESLMLPEVPLHEPFRSLAQHEWYHTGQLVSYLWMRGDDPYGW